MIITDAWVLRDEGGAWVLVPGEIAASDAAAFRPDHSAASRQGYRSLR